MPMNTPPSPSQRSQPKPLAASMPTRGALPSTAERYASSCWENSSQQGSETTATLIPWAARLFGVEHLRTVATADLNTTVGMALGVFLLIQWIGITHKGIGVFVGEWFTAPFHAHGTLLKVFLAPINLAFRVIEEVVRPLSLSMRLFGNMYAGELIFLLIACFTLGAALDHISTYFLGIAQFGAGVVWTVFHYLIITLQAFIFMVLTIVYVGISAEKH